MRRVLVVEDDPDFVELLTHPLKREGWAVDAVGDGREASSACAPRPISS